MSASHPTFASGHCMMIAPLNRQEVEFVGETLIARLRSKRLTLEEITDPEDFKREIERTNRILRKMDHPLFEE